ncbi:MAG: hypothetical protein BWY44_01308 [Candidatus Omnitrophica bacterium ADurb.Bin292]|nr:MAG: hypothetical protein BWY44_01308 [Candidatus Omnitrophica bacterium ADurb.Bin292]
MMLLAFFAVLVLLVHSYGGQIRTVHANLETVKSFLKVPEVEYKFFGIHFDLRGRYRGRKIVYTYRMSERRATAYYNISVEPKILLPEQKGFILDYPRPTQNTQLVRGKIRYSRRSLFGEGFFDTKLCLFSPGEVSEVLEELSEAARRVESGEWRP